jgi:predicted CopG family antitoxin
VTPRRRNREVGFSDDEYRGLQRIARERGLSFSALIRNLAMTQTRLRTCRNATCPRSGEPFEPARMDQRYCGKHCGGAQRAREWRHRELDKKTKQTVGQDLEDSTR